MNTNIISESNLNVCIAARAYELFEQRNRTPGHEAADWLQAEREVRHHFGLTPSSNHSDSPNTH